MGRVDAPADEPSARVRRFLESGMRDEAYASVVETTKDALYRFLHSFLRDEDEARDAFQETYLRVFRAIGNFRGDASLQTWVLKIGRNVALNRMRDEGRRSARTVSIDVSGEGPWLPHTEPDVCLGDQTLRQAVQALPLAQREAIALFYIEGLSLSEVAAVTGRPPNTTKSDLRRARQRLRRLIAL